MRDSFKRILFAVISLTLQSAGDATASTIQTTSFRFVTGAEPAFHYVSNDLPCEIFAEVSGQFELEYDDDTGEAWLHSVAATLFAAEPWEFNDCYGAHEEFNGADVTTFMAGLASGLQGQRSTPSEFEFGLMLNEDRSYMFTYTLSVHPHESRFSGSSIFYGADGSDHFLNAVIVPVPEPLIMQLLCVAIGAFSYGIRRSHTVAQSRDSDSHKAIVPIENTI